MWKLIQDCGKQLNNGYRLRQAIREDDVDITEYIIAEMDMDEYKLQLVSKSKNGAEVPVDANEVIILNCEQIIQYQLEVWEENNA